MNNTDEARVEAKFKARLKGSGEPEIGATRPHRLQDVFDGLAARGDERGEVEVGEILAGLAHRSYGPLLLLPALISILPVIGALPGVTWTMAALSLLISLQFLFNRRALWLPGGVKRIRISAAAFDSALERVNPVLRFLDGFIHPRLNMLLAPPWPFFIALLCVMLSLAMFALSLLPGGVVIPALGLVLLAIGLTTHDGLVILLGGAASAAALYGVSALII